MGWIEYANYRQRRVEAGASVVREVGRREVAAMRRSASSRKTDAPGGRRSRPFALRGGDLGLLERHRHKPQRLHVTLS